MICGLECIQSSKNDRNTVIAEGGLYDFDNSNYTVATHDPDVEDSHVSSHGDSGGAGSSGTL